MRVCIPRLQFDGALVAGDGGFEMARLLQCIAEVVVGLRIVGIDETDAKKGDVSWISPIAKALLNARVEDAVTLRTPRGDEDLVVKKIVYSGRG